MSAAATAAGYLYASGRLLKPRAEREKFKAERAAAGLRREREQRTSSSTGAKRTRR